METKSDNVVDKTKCRHDWYQTDSHVILTVFIKNVNKDKLKIVFDEREISIDIDLEDDIKFSTKFYLWESIRPNECSYKVFLTKIEIKSKKKEGLKWESLERSRKEDIPEKKLEKGLPTYPSSSKKKHDWNKIEAQVKNEEENEKPEGDAALNQLFQKIYSDGSEEVKKAMNKSFMESGGTVLSTNWKEIKEKSVDVKPPDGMEWKKWDN